VLVFLRVDALAGSFLRFAFVLAVAFFLVAIKASLDVETAGAVPDKNVSQWHCGNLWNVIYGI
jgi:hypothetical protein